jgi:lysophospholipase L1-like esterase
MNQVLAVKQGVSQNSMINGIANLQALSELESLDLSGIAICVNDILMNGLATLTALTQVRGRLASRPQARNKLVLAGVAMAGAIPIFTCCSCKRQVL